MCSAVPCCPESYLKPTKSSEVKHGRTGLLYWMGEHLQTAFNCQRSTCLMEALANFTGDFYETPGKQHTHTHTHIFNQKRRCLNQKTAKFYMNVGAHHATLLFMKFICHLLREFLRKSYSSIIITEDNLRNRSFLTTFLSNSFN